MLSKRKDYKYCIPIKCYTKLVEHFKSSIDNFFGSGKTDAYKYYIDYNFSSCESTNKLFTNYTTTSPKFEKINNIDTDYYLLTQEEKNEVLNMAYFAYVIYCHKKKDFPQELKEKIKHSSMLLTGNDESRKAQELLIKDAIEFCQNGREQFLKHQTVITEKHQEECSACHQYQRKYTEGALEITLSLKRKIDFTYKSFIELLKGSQKKLNKIGKVQNKNNGEEATPLTQTPKNIELKFDQILEILNKSYDVENTNLIRRREEKILEILKIDLNALRNLMDEGFYEVEHNSSKNVEDYFKLPSPLNSPSTLKMGTVTPKYLKIMENFESESIDKVIEQNEKELGDVKILRIFLLKGKSEMKAKDKNSFTELELKIMEKNCRKGIDVYATFCCEDFMPASSVDNFDFSIFGNEKPLTQIIFKDNYYGDGFKTTARMHIGTYVHGDCYINRYEKEIQEKFFTPLLQDKKVKIYRVNFDVNQEHLNINNDFKVNQSTLRQKINMLLEIINRKRHKNEKLKCNY